MVFGAAWAGEIDRAASAAATDTAATVVVNLVIFSCFQLQRNESE
jgi:hypothetical protein